MHSGKQWHRRECSYSNRCLIWSINAIIIIIIIIIERLIFKRTSISYFDKLWIYLHAGLLRAALTLLRFMLLHGISPFAGSWKCWLYFRFCATLPIFHSTLCNSWVVNFAILQLHRILTVCWCVTVLIATTNSSELIVLLAKTQS
jgi:hypothetical protein